MFEAELEIPTDDGMMGTFIVHPDGDGPHPVVLFLMDAPGKRPLLHDMARRLVSNGYYVMLPNLYYRTTPEFQLDFASKESFGQMVDLMGNLGNRKVGRDAGALLPTPPTLRRTPRVSAVVGYCMSGPFSIWVAAEYPEQVKAAASFYGVRLQSTRKTHHIFGSATSTASCTSLAPSTMIMPRPRWSTTSRPRRRREVRGRLSVIGAPTTVSLSTIGLATTPEPTPAIGRRCSTCSSGSWKCSWLTPSSRCRSCVDFVATLTPAPSARKLLLTAGMIEELADALEALDTDTSCRAVGLFCAPEGKHFCAGADFSGVGRSADSTADLYRGGAAVVPNPRNRSSPLSKARRSVAGSAWRWLPTSESPRPRRASRAPTSRDSGFIRVLV